jgi:hypothetical protein
MLVSRITEKDPTKNTFKLLVDDSGINAVKTLPRTYISKKKAE